MVFPEATDRSLLLGLLLPWGEVNRRSTPHKSQTTCALRSAHVV